VSTRFAENVLDATNAFALYLDDAGALAGVPDDALQMYSEAAAADGRTGYKISLQYPSYAPIVDYADDRNLRQQLYRAHSTRASELGKPEWNNGPLMVDLLKLRRAHAELLGFRNFARSRWCRRWRARTRCSRSCVTWADAPNPTPNATWPNTRTRRRRTRHRRSAALGLLVRERKAA
jgi:Zn-dependent oligopeptidase